MTTRKKYTREFKQDAVRLVTEQGYNKTEAARNLGLDRSVLARSARTTSDMIARADHMSTDPMSTRAERWG